MPPLCTDAVERHGARVTGPRSAAAPDRLLLPQLVAHPAALPDELLRALVAACEGTSLMRSLLERPDLTVEHIRPLYDAAVDALDPHYVRQYAAALAARLTGTDLQAFVAEVAHLDERTHGRDLALRCVTDALTVAARAQLLTGDNLLAVAAFARHLPPEDQLVAVQHIHAHLPTAVARMSQGDYEQAVALTRELIDALRRHRHLGQAAVLSAPAATIAHLDLTAPTFTSAELSHLLDVRVLPTVATAEAHDACAGDLRSFLLVHGLDLSGADLRRVAAHPLAQGRERRLAQSLVEHRAQLVGTVGEAAIEAVVTALDGAVPWASTLALLAELDPATDVEDVICAARAVHA